MLKATFLPLFRLILIYISGMLLAIYYPRALSITLTCLLVLSLLYFCMRATATELTWLNPIALLLIFLIGYANLLLQHAQQKKLTNWKNQHVTGYSLCIQKVYDPLRCKGLITHIKDNIGWHNANASIQLYFRKKCDYKPKKGDKLLIRGAPACSLPSESIEQITPFTSLHYIARYRHILKQVDQDFIWLQSFYESGKWATITIEWCSRTLQKWLKDEQAMAVVTRLLWGAKERIAPDLEKAYATTGTIHVLAISGLHVGMFYLLIKAVFRFLFSKIGFFILAELCTLLWLWLYAGLCHFAPPILRATIMITMSRLGFLMGRGSNPYNGLLASAFALLLWKPFVLFNCGFQLSYAATLGILYLQPPIHRLIIFQNKWLQKIWTATTLSIAAQTSTLPLILYYFKQFPLYFIIANWLVVPTIFAILVLSLALLVASHLPIVGMLLGFTLEKLIIATNALVSWMAKWPMSTLAPCAINGRSAALLYIMLFALCLFVQYKHLVYPIIMSLCTILHTVDRIQRLIAKQKKCKMSCYNNDSLSFALKDNIETLSCNRLPNSSLLRHYAGGTIAVWYGKVILTIHTIPSDWYRWHGTKLDVDYLLINENLLEDIPIIFKVLHVRTLVIYTKQTHRFYYSLPIKKLSIRTIWLKTGDKKALTWPKNL